MMDARRSLRRAAVRWALAALAAALVALAACASPGAAPAPTSRPTSPPAVAPAIAPATGTSVVAEPSAVVQLKAADELEQLRGQGQPILLAVLDRSRGDDYGLSDG